MFSNNEVVFAKVRGYQAWPAYVSKFENNKYHIVFFGTNETALCKEVDVLPYNKYVTETLPNKRITPSLKIALEEAKTHLELNPIQNEVSSDENIEEIFLYNPAEQTSMEICEINSQLLHEKEKMESSLRLAEEEAAEMCGNFEKEIASLRNQIKLLETKLFEKDKKLLELQTKLTIYNSSEELNYLSPKVCISTSTQTREEALGNEMNEQLLIRLEQYEKELNSKQVLILQLRDSIDELNESAENEKCLHCYPPLQHSDFTDVKVKSRNKTKNNSPPKQKCTVVSENPFNSLELEDNEDDGKLTKEISKPRHGTTKKPNAKNNTQANINVESKTPVVTNTRPKLIILADSHGKNLSSMVEQRSSLNVCSYVRPGARFHQVVEEVEEITKNLTNEDHLLVIAGTNSVETTGVNRLMMDVNSLISSVKHTNLLLATLPMRHDRCELDIKISRVNGEIESISELNKSTVKLLPLHLLPRHLFTTHGLHMNRRGKYQVAKMIKELLQRKDIEPEAALLTSTTEATPSEQYPPDSSNPNIHHQVIGNLLEEIGAGSGLSSGTALPAGRELSPSTLVTSPNTTIINAENIRPSFLYQTNQLIKKNNS
ncbi:PC4 and SFRS1-interacting protein [Homalodisca vitripennis]|nr:PC4 and SFRS1-interacting protein [Homalodisca vitripennis]